MSEEIADVETTAREAWLGIRSLIDAVLDEPFEHVSVLHEGERRDMFVGETSAINGKCVMNIRATEIYRAATMAREPQTDPDTLPAIFGTAVLFDERVWF